MLERSRDVVLVAVSCGLTMGLKPLPLAHHKLEDSAIGARPLSQLQAAVAVAGPASGAEVRHVTRHSETVQSGCLRQPVGLACC